MYGSAVAVGEGGRKRRARPLARRPASPAGPSSSQNIWPRVPNGKPSSGMTGELCSQPPDGVAEIMLPSLSMMSKCTVSPVVWPTRPTVGSPAPLDATPSRTPSARRQLHHRRHKPSTLPGPLLQRRLLRIDQFCGGRCCRRPTAGSSSARRRTPDRRRRLRGRQKASFRHSICRWMKSGLVGFMPSRLKNP